MTGIWSETPTSSFTVQPMPTDENRSVVPFTLNPYSLNPLAPPTTKQPPPIELRLKRAKQLLAQYPFAPPFNGPPSTLNTPAVAPPLPTSTTTSAAAAAAKRASTKPPSLPPRTSLIPSWHPASSPLAPRNTEIDTNGNASSSSATTTRVSLPLVNVPPRRLPEQLTASLDRAVPTSFDEMSTSSSSSGAASTHYPQLTTAGIPFIFHLAHLLSSIEYEDSRLGRDRMVSGMSVAHELAAVITRRQGSYYTFDPIEVQIRRSYLVYETMAMALLSQHVGLANCRPVSCTATFITHLPIKLWPTVPRLAPNGPLITGDAALNRVANFIDAHRTSLICHLLNALHEKHEYKPHMPHLIKMIEMLAMVGPEMSTMNLMAFLVASRTFFRLLYRVTDPSSANVLLSLLGADPPLTPAVSSILVDALERQYFPPEQRRTNSSASLPSGEVQSAPDAPSRSSLPPSHTSPPQTLLNFYAAVALSLRQAVDAVLRRKPVKPHSSLLWRRRRGRRLLLQQEDAEELKRTQVGIGWGEGDEENDAEAKRMDIGELGSTVRPPAPAPAAAATAPPPQAVMSTRRQEWQSWSGDESSSAVSVEEPLSPGVWVRGNTRSKRRRIASEGPAAAADDETSAATSYNNYNRSRLRRAFSEEPPWSDEWSSARCKPRRCFSLSRLSSSRSTSPSWGKTGMGQPPSSTPVTSSPPVPRRFRFGGNIGFAVQQDSGRRVVKQRRHLAQVDKKEEAELVAITDFLRRLLDGSLLVLAAQPQFIMTSGGNSTSAPSSASMEVAVSSQTLERHPQAQLIQRIFLTAGVCEDLGRILFLPVRTSKSRRRPRMRRRKRSRRLRALCSRLPAPRVSLSTTRCALLTLANLAATATKTSFGPFTGFCFQLLGRLQITAPAAVIFIHRVVSDAGVRWSHVGCFPKKRSMFKQAFPAAVVEALTCALQALLAVALHSDKMLPQDPVYWASLAKLFLLGSLSDIARLRVSRVLSALLARSVLGPTAENLIVHTPFLRLFTSTLRYCLEHRESTQAERFLGPSLEFGCALDDCIQMKDHCAWKVNVRNDPEWKWIEHQISLYRVGRAKGPPDLSLMIPLEQTRKLRDQRKSEEKCQRQRRTPPAPSAAFVSISTPNRHLD